MVSVFTAVGQHFLYVVCASASVCMCAPAYVSPCSPMTLFEINAQEMHMHLCRMSVCDFCLSVCVLCIVIRQTCTPIVTEELLLLFL